MLIHGKTSALTIMLGDAMIDFSAVLTEPCRITMGSVS
jgi:hypothetical protein